MPIAARARSNKWNAASASAAPLPPLSHGPLLQLTHAIHATNQQLVRLSTIGPSFLRHASSRSARPESHGLCCRPLGAPSSWFC